MIIEVNCFSNVIAILLTRYGKSSYVQFCVCKHLLDSTPTIKMSKMLNMYTFAKLHLFCLAISGVLLASSSVGEWSPTFYLYIALIVYEKSMIL